MGVVLLAPLTLLLVAAFLFGWRFQPIETASMAPSYPAGSLAIVEPIDPVEVEPGMTIVFADPQGRHRLVAHRAVARLPGNAWQTKGDANTAPDPIPVQARDIRGRVVSAVPVLGYAVTALRGPQAVILLVGLPLAVLLVTELREWRRRRPAPGLG